MTRRKKSVSPQKWKEIGDILLRAREAAGLTQKEARRYLMAAAKYPTEISERILRDYESGRSLPEADRLLCLLNLYAIGSLPRLPEREAEDERVSVCPDPVMAPSTHVDHQRVVQLVLEVAVVLISRAGDQSRVARKRRDDQLAALHYRNQGAISFEDAKFQERPWTKQPPPSPPRRQ